MIRPQVVTFLDEMLRSDQALRVEEVERRRGATPASGSAMIEQPGPDHILLAIRSGGAWPFNPAPDLAPRRRVVVVMATPEGRKSLEARFDPGSAAALPASA